MFREVTLEMMVDESVRTRLLGDVVVMERDYRQQLATRSRDPPASSGGDYSAL